MRDVSVWERLAIGMLAITGVALLLTAVAHLRVYGYLSELRVGILGVTGVDEARAEELDAAVSLWSVVSVLCTLLTSLPFLVWLRGSVGNLHARGFSGLRFSEGWAVGWWFVPFLNLVRPYQVVQELHGASEAARDGATTIRSAGAPLISWWWAAWIGSAAFGCCSGGLMATSGGDLDGLKLATLGSVGGTLVRLAAAALAVRVVTTISRLQQEWPRQPETPPAA